MKRILLLTLAAVILIAAAGCGETVSEDRAGSQSSTVSDVLEAGIAEAEGTDTGKNGENTVTDNSEGAATSRQSTVNENAPVPEEIDESSLTLSKTEGIDIDLTSLSSTVVYTEVYNMMMYPENYIGKTVKMQGPFASIHDEVADVYYFACIIKDATACCSQGIEFVLTDDYKYPDDYPEVGDEITVTGVFDTYEEGEYTYCTLRNAELV